MTDPYAQLEQLIQSADAANAKFAQAEVNAANEYYVEVASFAKESRQQKRSANVFWNTHLKDVDDYLIQTVRDSLNKYGYSEKSRNLQSDKFKPSDAINDWRLDESGRSDIHEMVRVSRRLAYEAYSDWFDSREMVQKINIMAVVGIGLTVLLVITLYLRGG